MLQELTTKATVSQIGEDVGLELGKQMVKRFSEENPQDVKSYLVGREIIERILAQPGCVGIKMYNAINEKDEKTLVYVGVDCNGQAIVEYSTVDFQGTIRSNKGIVADRVKTDDGGNSDWDIWKWLFS